MYIGILLIIILAIICYFIFNNNSSYNLKFKAVDVYSPDVYVNLYKGNKKVKFDALYYTDGIEIPVAKNDSGVTVSKFDLTDDEIVVKLLNGNQVNIKVDLKSIENLNSN